MKPAEPFVENKLPSGGPPPGSRGGSSWPSPSRLGRLCLKELRETLRDRRTILTLVLMPLLVYPLLSVAFQRLLASSQESPGRVDWVIGVSPPGELPRLQTLLALGDRLLQREAENGPHQAPAAGGARQPPADAQRPAAIRWETGEDAEQDVREARTDLAIMVQRQDDSAGGPDAADCELLYRRNSELSRSAYDFVSQRLRAVNEFVLQEQIRNLGGQAAVPVRTAVRAVEGSGAAVPLTTLVPLILILMTITGAVYPAIDLTAGERERGTLEMLMAAPVPRLGLLAAKYVAVLTVAMLTAGANLAAMTVTLSATGLGRELFGKSGWSWSVLLMFLALLVLFAAFFSAVLLTLTSVARSFKEAQAYLIPLMLISLVPGVISLLPGIEFNRLLAVTPLLNLVLLARGLFDGDLSPGLALLTMISTVFYSLSAIGLAARFFGADALLYGSERSWADLAQRPPEVRGAASLPGALFCVALLFPGAVLIAGFLARQEVSMPGRLLLNGLATVVLFSGVPLAAAWLQRVRLRPGFRWHAPRAGALAAALVVGVALWPWAHEVFLLNRVLGLAALTESQVQLVREMLAQLQNIPPAVILVSLALIPAVCEELFFRGYLFQALSCRFSPLGTLLISAVLFGLFHVVASSAAALERFLPSTFLGLMLGWVCWRSGSVLPGMVLHGCHNGLLLMIAYYRDELAARGWGLQEQAHLPAGWLAVSALVVLVALGLLELLGRRRPRAPDGQPGPFR
jgi:ABC-2 type transport system permease protein/sodium transport system permease protein